MNKSLTSQRALLSGQLLVSDFQTALVSVATMEAATFEAKRSENELMDYLSSVSTGSILNPSNLNADPSDNLTRASLDAHVKKVQASQMQSMGAVQLEQLSVADRSAYTGRKIRVNLLRKDRDAIESIWFDKHKGYFKGIVKRGKVTGVIESVHLDKNALILKPSFGMRLINPALQNYIVYVVDPVDLSPAVQIDLL